MANLTLISVGGVTITKMTGGAPSNGNVLNSAQNGNAFSWETPNNLKISFDYSSTATLGFSDSDGILKDDPYLLDVVTDQRLTSAVKIDGKTYTPSASTIRWQYPPPVTVENEYSVVLYDDAGKAYQMNGVSITTGYTTQVVGVAFLGEAPPAGTSLYYIQGKSTYNGNPQAPISGLTVVPAAPPCFLLGTRIATPSGSTRVEDLAPGDLVLTADNGARPILWIGSARVSGLGPLAPVRIRAGHLGNARDLWVSPNHRVMLTGYLAELLFGEDEVLVAAKHLVDGTQVTVEPVTRADYFHILLEDHEILLAEGAKTESLYPGEEALKGLSPDARAELHAIFADIPWEGALSRPALSGHEGRLLRAA